MEAKSFLIEHSYTKVLDDSQEMKLIEIDKSITNDSDQAKKAALRRKKMENMNMNVQNCLKTLKGYRRCMKDLKVS